MPEFVPLVLLFLLGAMAASLGNAAAYEWAWNRRRISPWQPTPEGVADRGWIDCVPILGWLRLRRDADALGRGFWVRPLVVEILFGAVLAGLWWWEVTHHALVATQPGAPWPVSGYPAWTPFVFHAVLAWLMLVASLIDLDEKTIPDEITVPGALVGLVLASLLPMGHLPNVEELGVGPDVGVALRGPKGGLVPGPLAGGTLYVEPVHVDAPNEWPAWLNGGPDSRGALAVGLGCFLLWCFALTTRVWRVRHGCLYGLCVMLRRVGRDLQSRPLREITIAGVLGITSVWYMGGAAWQGLLTALVGMIGAGSIIWAVRIVGTAALRREAMGFGDVTLMMMVGAYLGWQAGMVIFFLAPFAALLVGLLQLVLGRGDEIPYGPFLCLAACFVVTQWGWLWSQCEALFSLGAAVPIVMIVCLTVLGVLLAVWRQIKIRLLGMSEDWEEE